MFSSKWIRNAQPVDLEIHYQLGNFFFTAVMCLGPSLGVWGQSQTLWGLGKFKCVTVAGRVSCIPSCLKLSVGQPGLDLPASTSQFVWSGFSSSTNIKNKGSALRNEHLVPFTMLPFPLEPTGRLKQMAGYHSAQCLTKATESKQALGKPDRDWRRDWVARQGKKSRARPARQRSAERLDNRK